MNFVHGGNVFAIARSLGVAPEEMLDFSASINPLGMAPGVKDAVNAGFDRLLHYPDDGVVELQLALAGLHGLEPANICVSNGSTELIHLAPRLVPGRRALIVAPPFAEYGEALRRSGWEAEYFILTPESGFALSLDALRKRLEQGYDLLFLCNPGNPTGSLVTRADMAAVIDLCRATGTFLILDEAFMDFCEEESAKKLVVANGNGIVLRSMTKFYALPGLRLGYALASSELADRISALRLPWSVNTMAQIAGLASLADAEYRQATLESIAGERCFLYTGLAAIPGLKPYPSAANYLLVEIATGLSAGLLQERLLSERIIIRNCGNFTGLSERFFRVAVRRREENERLIAALADALSSLSYCGASKGSAA
jgi:threonine-phosphate decarboxylase